MAGDHNAHNSTSAAPLPSPPHKLIRAEPGSASGSAAALTASPTREAAVPLTAGLASGRTAPGAGAGAAEPDPDLEAALSAAIEERFPSALLGGSSVAEDGGDLEASTATLRAASPSRAPANGSAERAPAIRRPPSAVLADEHTLHAHHEHGAHAHAVERAGSPASASASASSVAALSLSPSRRSAARQQMPLEAGGSPRSPSSSGPASAFAPAAMERGGSRGSGSSSSRQSSGSASGGGTGTGGGSHFLPSADDGVFIRRPGQAWQPQVADAGQHTALLQQGGFSGGGVGGVGVGGVAAGSAFPLSAAATAPPLAGAPPPRPREMQRSFSSQARAGAAAASLSGLLERRGSGASSSTLDHQQQHQQQQQLAAALDQQEALQSEDSPLTKGLQSVWQRLTAAAAAPDADGVIRGNGGARSEPASTAAPPASGAGGAASQLSGGFFDAVSTLRSAIGLGDDGWLAANKADLETQAERAEREEAEAKAKGAAGGEQGGMKVEDGRHSGQTLPKQPLLRVQDKWQTPRLPVCFSHGLFGFDQLTLAPSFTISYWRGIIDALEANGCEVLVCRVPTSASIQERAAALKAQIEERFPGREINIIAHSMGGLDSRYLVSQLRPSFTVRTLTTITTPHRGSTFADFMLDRVIGRDKLPRLLSMLTTVGLPGGGKAFEQLCVGYMKELNSRMPDNPATQYYSWGAQFTPGVLNEFRVPHSIIYEAEGPNDGLVSVESARWGRYMGTLDNVSHLQIVGWHTGGPLTKLMWGQGSVFSAQNFYMQICEDLAKDGF